jgi:chaperone required for assembly of F1-ATPase
MDKIMDHSILNSIAESAAKAQKPIANPLPRKFYKLASHENGALMLDGRTAKTPAKKPLIAPLHVADALAWEWNAQQDVINPATMPLTRLLNSIIDGVVDKREEVGDEIIKYAGSDFICYLSGETPEFVTRQLKLWQPVLDHFKTKHHAEFKTTEAINFIKQPDISLDNLRKTLPEDPFKLGALNTLTTLMGSSLLAIALFEKAFTPDYIWQAAHVEEDYQIELWGADEEAEARRKARHAEYNAAVSLL